MFEVAEKYFLWLCDRADCRGAVSRDVLEYLFDTDFYSLVNNDDNRCSDGLALRSLYSNEINDEVVAYRVVNMRKPCSVLEMMLAVSDRISYILSDDHETNWFVELAKNLQLDEDYDIDNKVYIFLERKYTSYGKGGLFPLKNPGGKCQRKVEIWYQMMAYIREILE